MTIVVVVITESLYKSEVKFLKPEQERGVGEFYVMYRGPDERRASNSM